MDGRMFDTYLSFCSVYKLAAPWDFVPPDHNAYLGPEDPSAAFDLLLAKFSPGDLRAVGLIHENSAGCLAINPLLAAPSTPLLALRDPRLGHVNNLLTEGGCITTYRHPFLSVLFDKHTYVAIEGMWPELFLTAALDDAILLRSFGFAAAPVVGLSDINQRGLELLGRYFDVKRSLNDAELDGKCTPPTRTAAENAELLRDYPGPQLPWALPGSLSASECAQYYVTMTLVRWSPQACSRVEPPAIRKAVCSLDALKLHRDYDLTAIHQWDLTDKYLQSLQFAIAKREAAWAKSTLFDSLDHSSRCLESRPDSKSPVDWGTACQCLQMAFRTNKGDSESAKRRAAALTDYLTSVDENLLGPLQRHVQAIPDPLERALNAQLIEYLILHSQKMVAVREQMCHWLKSNSPSCENEEKKNVSDMLVFSKQILQLSNAIRACKTIKPLFRPAKFTATRTSGRSTSSDSPKKN